MIYIEPHAGVTPIVNLINSAHKQVSMEVYFVDDRLILQALKRAHEHGVNVRVIIDGKPYGMRPWKVKSEARKLQKTGATVQYAPARFESGNGHWRFMHEKATCTLHACEIGSANYGYDSFHRDRDFLYVTQKPDIVRAINDVFNADWTGRRAGNYAHQVLVLSPGTSAGQIVNVIDQPGPIEIESEEMGPFRETLDAIAAKGAQAHVILPANISRTGQRDVDFLRQHGVQVRLMPVHPLYDHSKTVITQTEVFIGSENFTRTSLESDREAGVITHNPHDIVKMKEQFAHDWAMAQ